MSLEAFPSAKEFAHLLQSGFNQIPVVRVLALEVTPQDLFAALPGASFLFETSLCTETDHISIVALSPFVTIRAKNGRAWVDGQEVPEDPLAVVAQHLHRWRGIRWPQLPLFCGGLCGFFGYEAAQYMDCFSSNPNDDLNLPDVLLFGINRFVAVDHRRRQIFAVVCGEDYGACSAAVDQLAMTVAETTAVSCLQPQETKPADTVSNFGSGEYLAAIEKVQEYIAAGDTYQTNLSQRLSANTTRDPWTTYRRLTQLNPVPMAAYFPFAEGTLVCSSPERLVRTEAGLALTRPIGGTRRKGTTEENARFVRELQTDPKERAEHGMLVDIERNDLSRVCVPGSVQVRRLLEISDYTHVMHIESEIVGTLRPNTSPLNVLRAMFPGGTVTGVPKLRTMEIITELEPNTRGLYTGSLGYFTFAGDVDFNILIRCILFHEASHMAYVHVGGGVTFDAQPVAEHKETLNKARSQLLALGGS